MKSVSVLVPIFILTSVFTACPPPVNNEPALPSVSISNLTQTDFDDTSMSLEWETDTPADCTVEYGPYSFYGKSAAATAGADKMLHTVALTGLDPSTSYNIRISANPESSGYHAGSTGNTEYKTQVYCFGQALSSNPWESVGALCFSDADGFYGPFCTAVLIDNQHAVTCAHCLEVGIGEYGRIPAASNTEFYIGGADAGDPSTGTLYGVAGITIHSSYDGTPGEDDLAVIELDQPVSGIAPATRNTQALSSGSYNTTVIGFDTANFEVKRIAYPTIDSIDTSTLAATSDAANLGDAGSAAFYDFAGDGSDWRLIGIAASAAPSGSDPYVGPSEYMRIDAYDAWFDSVTN